MPKITNTVKVIHVTTKTIVYSYSEIETRVLDSYGNYLKDTLEEALQMMLEGRAGEYDETVKGVIRLEREGEFGNIWPSCLKNDLFPFWASEVIEYVEENDEEVLIKIDYPHDQGSVVFSSKECDW